MKILVTGGAGFIGANLCQFLIENGDEVICMDDLSTGSRENIRPLMDNKNFTFVQHDVEYPFPNFIDVDQIYHLACPASPPQYQFNKIKTTRTSVLGSINVLEFASLKKCRVLISSTSEVYGDPLENPQKESYRGNVNCVGPRSCYDEGKRVAETLFMDYHDERKVDIRIVRIFNTYGPYMDKDDGRVVSNFIIQALKNQDITIFGDGEQTRSFQYVTDLISGIYKMMNQVGFIGPVNIGNPNEFTVKQLAEKVIELTNSSSKLTYGELPKDDPVKRNPDISLAREKLSWEPVVELDEGLKKAIEYFKSVLQ